MTFTVGALSKPWPTGAEISEDWQACRARAQVKRRRLDPLKEESRRKESPSGLEEVDGNKIANDASCRIGGLDIEQTIGYGSRDHLGNGTISVGI